MIGLLSQLLLWLVLTTSVAGLTACRARATTFTQVTSDSTHETDPAPSPDGKWIAFTSDRAGHGATQIYVMPAEGGEARQLTHEPDSIRAATPSWSPDGKTILFVSTRGKRYNVYSVPFEGGEPRQLTHAPGGHRFACYSPDGKKIAFYSNRLAPTELYGFNIYVMDASGEQETEMARQVTHSRGSPGHPTWSADGRWIAYVAKEYDAARQQTMEGNILFAKYHVYKVPSIGGKEVQLTSGTVAGEPLEDTWPCWSPDGKWIAFGRTLGAKRDLWALHVATGRAVRITTEGDCMKPTWTSDSKSIYYSVLKPDGKSEDIWIARDLDLKVPPAPKGAGKARASTRGSRGVARAVR